MTTIRWTETADTAYITLLRKVYDRSTEAALALDLQLEKLLERLRQFCYHCPPLENIPGLRRCLITQNLGLVYDVSGDEITIISVYDTRTNNPFQ
ncbi:MAG: type II toxin-antitoxin system RelE/ParE family toxin [Lewinellaceae bacterium]|nr:type II toxin-antitoxin system RelE/ParE family toxin [Lewinellaceae bacterium]